jgi:sec-independent protein translocase protein TatB
MFGMGFTEIILIALIAIIALGPEKLPTAMVEVAKFFKNFKNGITQAKDAIDQEINISELKENAESYKQSLLHTKETIIKESGIEQASEEMAKINKQLHVSPNILDKSDDNKDKIVS